MAVVDMVLKSMPYALLLYWALATGAALFTLLPGGLAPSFRAAVLLSASRGKTWEHKPKAPLGPLTVGLFIMLGHTQSVCAILDCKDHSVLDHNQDVHVPQSWFAHFYMVGTACNALTLVLLMSVSGEPDLSQAEAIARIGLCMLQLHLTRRLMESVLLFDYPASARMHFIAYIFGMSYYIVLPLTLLPGSQWERLGNFLASKDQHWNWGGTSWQSGEAGVLSNLQDAMKPAVVLGVCVFVMGNLLQFQSHWILARLRRQLSRQGKKEGDYSIPRGGAFELVSCPHYLGEIVIYGGLTVMLAQHNLLIFVVFSWVVANLLLAAGPTHRWYKGHFKQYPENRRALIPFLY